MEDKQAEERALFQDSLEDAHNAHNCQSAASVMESAGYFGPRVAT